MALLKIRKFPDDSLKQPATPVKNINGNVEGLIDSMVQTMYAAPGVGLAAPQVGESKRIIVLDTPTMNNPASICSNSSTPGSSKPRARSFGKRDACR